MMWYLVRSLLVLALGLTCTVGARAQQADALFASGFEDSVGAARFLDQATFGPTLPEIARVQRVGYAAWLDEQFAKPLQLHTRRWTSARARLRAQGAT